MTKGKTAIIQITKSGGGKGYKWARLGLKNVKNG